MLLHGGAYSAVCMAAMLWLVAYPCSSCNVSLKPAALDSLLSSSCCGASCAAVKRLCAGLAVTHKVQLELLSMSHLLHECLCH